MDASSAEPPKKPKSSFLSFLAWWQVDPQEVQRQVDHYDTLSVWRSARRLSGLLCGVSVCLTLVMSGYLGLSQATIVFEVVLWGGLGLLMYQGRRWAFIVAMFMWTLEKGALIVGGVSANRTPFGQIIWWAVYMHAFFLGLKVENARLRLTRPLAAPPRAEV